ncbi:MAG: LysR family transcriptional regulator [Janthinobacterium lividum]
MTDSKKSILPDDINWDHLKRFKICAESKNFKEAAAKIGTSTTALSHQIDTLEIELNYKLFELVNHNRTLKLTDQGNHLFQMVSMAHLYLNGSRPTDSDYLNQQKLKRKVKIKTTPGLAANFLPNIIDKFLVDHNEYQFEIFASGPVGEIQNDEIVIRSDIKNQKDIIKELIGKISLNLYASKDYIAKMGEPLKIEDLQNHKVLSFSASTYGNTNWALLPNQGFPVSTQISSNSADFLHGMCCQGYGIVELAEIYPRSNQLVHILKDIKSPKHPIYLAFHKSNLVKSEIVEFLRFSLQYFKNKP